MSEWIEGPALEIIKQVNAFAPGDEVVFGEGKCPHEAMSDHKLVGYTLVVANTVSGSRMLDGWTMRVNVASIPFFGHNTWLMCPCNIVRWRRPEVK